MTDYSAVRPHNDPVRLGVYRHYKHTVLSPMYYLVIGIARRTGSEEKLVIYVPLYPAGGPRMAARPLEEFLSPAFVDNNRVERFTYVGTEIEEYSI